MLGIRKVHECSERGQQDVLVQGEGHVRGERGGLALHIPFRLLSWGDAIDDGTGRRIIIMKPTYSSEEAAVRKRGTNAHSACLWTALAASEICARRLGSVRVDA